MMAAMETVEFAKGHGTGNDFVIIPDPDGALDLAPGVVAALCDRRYGIGGDGVLRVVRSGAHPETAGAAGDAEWFMDYRNADGSVAEMCGNGVRVYARYLVDTGLAPAQTFTLATRTGPVAVTVSGGDVTAVLGRPLVGAASWAEIGGRRLAGAAVDCGNPHLVCGVPDQDNLAALDLSVPPVVDPAEFPAGVNVELVTPVAGTSGATVQVRMRVHERGVGETLSCGSGACAVAAVALRAAGHEQGTVVVGVPGGRLAVRLTDRACELSGPAVVVATGRFDVRALTRESRMAPRSTMPAW
jgi:diaminopimelate epimerase